MSTPPRAMAKGAYIDSVMDALKVMLDLHDMGLVTCVYPEGSQGRRQVEATTQQARLTLAATRRYGALYRSKANE